MDSLVFGGSIVNHELLFAMIDHSCIHILPHTVEALAFENTIYIVTNHLVSPFH